MKSYAFIEFSSIAEGLDYTYQVSKHVDVSIHHQELMCPGKYVLQLCAKEQNINYAMSYLAKYKTVLSSTAVMNLHVRVFDAINRGVAFKDGWNYGVIETKRYVQSLQLADKLAKNSTVQIERIVDRLGLIGKGLIIFSGTSSELKNARHIAEQQLETGEIVSISILEAVKEDMFSF